MKGFTSSLWPIHYKPLPDELLSCWLVRLAHGHGLKVQTFCNLIFGNRRQVWNRDIDRLAPTWLLDELSARTGTSPEAVFNTTLRAYEGLLYPKFRSSSVLQWILALKMYHRKREGYGLQFCPACLAADKIPYFRKRWRVAFYTVCTQHGIMLHDRCPQCGMAVALHRLDMAKLQFLEIDLIPHCYSCGFDLRNTPRAEPIAYDKQASILLMRLSREFDAGDNCEWDLGHYAVMHQICRIMTTRYRHVHLREFVLDQVGSQDLVLTHGHISFEMRCIEERHHLLQLTAWLSVDLEARITAAWKANAVRYNVLLKDFIARPNWYSSIVKKLENWRNK